MSACTLCDYTGWQSVEAKGVRAVQRCACYVAKHPSQVVGIPKTLESARLANFARRSGTEAAFSLGTRWLEGNGRADLYLAGPVGGGKTRLGCSLANEATRPGITACFVEVTDLLERVREFEFERGQGNRRSPLDLAEAADLLVLDDLGAMEKSSDFTLRTLLLLYNRRLGRRRRTIWTSNLSLDRLSEVFADDRLSSRIAGAAEVIWLDATDFRIEQRRESS